VKKVYVLLAVIGFAVGCDKSAPTTPTANPYTVTITSAGISPKSMDVPLGSRVLFVNNDSQARYMHSDPHPDATDCTALNQIGLLPAGQKRETGNLVEVRTCGFHDHDQPNNAAFRGQIVVK
jgi:hypothetical protein